MASLRPLDEEELGSFLERAVTEYADQRVKAGERPDVARRSAEEQTAVLFPDGRPAVGQHAYRVLDDEGTPVGTLWIGRHTPERPEEFWVWDVEIDAPHRGSGLGRAAMELAEAEARRLGAAGLGLNVFGHNRVARHLYESMGYETTAVNMHKAL